jgi:hypothetical protein
MSVALVASAILILACWKLASSLARGRARGYGRIVYFRNENPLRFWLEVSLNAVWASIAFGLIVWAVLNSN